MAASIDPVIAEILKSQGRLEAQVEMLMCDHMEDMKEDKAEGEDAKEESDSEYTNMPAISSDILNGVGPVFE